MNVNHTLIICVLSAIAHGCVDVEIGEPWQPVEPDPGTSTPDLEPPGIVPPPTATAPDGPSLVVEDLVRPTPSGCAEPALIDAPNPDNQVLRGPLVEEVYGADGCVDERWVRQWSGEQPREEFYDFFDESVGQNRYVQPFRYVRTWEYDHRGRVVGIEQADDPGGQPHFTETRRYEAGHLVEKTRRGAQWQPDGRQTETRETWEYDAEGRLLRYASLYDGTLSQMRRHEFDEAGRLLKSWEGRGDDSWLAVRNTYDDQGHLVQTETFGRGGSTTTTTTFERRRDGSLRRAVEHDLEHGWVNVWEYDEAERQTLYTQDEEGDGPIEYRQEFRWDDRGNKTFERVEYDFTGGVAGRIRQTTWTFDDESRLVERAATPAWHGGPEIRTSWDYDEAGVTVTTVYDRGEETRIHSVVRNTLDERLLWSEADADQDGVREHVVVQSWDGERLLTRVTDSDGDGVADSVLRNIYDRAGQMVETLQDMDGDGVVEHRRAWSRQETSPMR